MTRVNVLLLIALLFSSMYLVHASHESRQLFAELDKAQSVERLLDSEFERLKSDKQSQATPLRVERTARDKLAMRTATPAVTQYVSPVSPASAAAAAEAGNTTGKTR
jgi:cell division protein FtsL